MTQITTKTETIHYTDADGEPKTMVVTHVTEAADGPYNYADRVRRLAQFIEKAKAEDAPIPERQRPPE